MGQGPGAMAARPWNRRRLAPVAASALAPSHADANWLPAGGARYRRVVRLYEPLAVVFDGRWLPPRLIDE